MPHCDWKAACSVLRRHAAGRRHHAQETPARPAARAAMPGRGAPARRRPAAGRPAEAVPAPAQPAAARWSAAGPAGATAHVAAAAAHRPRGHRRPPCAAPARALARRYRPAAAPAPTPARPAAVCRTARSRPGRRVVLEAQDDLVELCVGLEMEALRRADDTGRRGETSIGSPPTWYWCRAAHGQADEAVGAESVGVDADAGTPGQAVQRQWSDRQVVHVRAQRLSGPDEAEVVRVEDAATDLARLVQIVRVEQAAARELDAGKAAGGGRFVGLR